MLPGVFRPIDEYNQVFVLRFNEACVYASLYQRAEGFPERKNVDKDDSCGWENGVISGVEYGDAEGRAGYGRLSCIPSWVQVTTSRTFDSACQMSDKLWKVVDFDYLFECAEPAGQTDESIDAGCHLDFAFMHRIYKNLKRSNISIIS